jgi:hypothetical protein
MSFFVPPPPPRKQHVVSQVLLRRFAVAGHIEATALAHPDSGWRRRSPAAVGYVEDFVRANAEEVEQVWGEVESRLAPALVDLDRGGSVESGGATEEALRDCLALHWARSRRVRAAADRAWDSVRTRSHADLATRPDLLDRSFLQLTGLHPAGPQARAIAIANDRLHEGPDDVRSGRHFADRVVEFFERARIELATIHIAVYDIPPEAEDLLLSDSPVVAPNSARTGWAPERLPWTTPSRSPCRSAHVLPWRRMTRQPATPSPSRKPKS